MDKNITYLVAILAIVSLVLSSYVFVVFQGQISDLKTSDNNFETSLSEIESSLNTIQATINDYQQTIAEQEEQIGEYETVTLVDSYGNVVKLTEFPERIVSLAPSNTEILFALGVGDNVVGVTDYCDYPYDFSEWVEAGNMTSIGSYYGPSIEPIVALEPDLILASSGSLEAADTLRTLGYNVIIVEGQSLDEILQTILLVGRATYKNTEASDLVSSLRARIDAVTIALQDVTTTPKVYYELYYEPLMSAGPTTFINEVISLAGGTNIFADATSSWPVVSSEEVITKNPDVMLLPDTYMSDYDYSIDDVDARPGWDSITAVQNSAIYEIQEDTLVRSGPRVVDALEAIAAFVHPEIFG